MFNRGDLETPTRPAESVLWPTGRKSAAAFTFDLDAESPILFESPTARSRAGVMSHQAYGPLSGVPRLLDMLEKLQVRSTFFVPGYTAHRYPGVVRDIAAAGHEIAHHGYLHEALEGVDPETEARYLDRGLEALADVAGIRPVGYRAPMWEPTFTTPGLLAERGFLYDSSLMDSDHPYELAVSLEEGQSIVEIPIYWGLDDWEQYCFLPGLSGSGLIESPAKVRDMWQSELRAFKDIGACFVLTCHPFLTGRPARAAALKTVIEDALNDPSIWVTSLQEIADHVRGLKLAPRTLCEPVLPEANK